MQSQVQNPDKTVAALIHLSTFSQFFFPFGNFVVPLLLWMAKKEDPFVNEHGRQALNFQISLYLYTVFLVIIGGAGLVLMGLYIFQETPFYFDRSFHPLENPGEAMPLVIYAMTILLLLLSLLALYIYAVISATTKASEGQLYQYPLSINFITPEPSGNQSIKNEQFNNTQNQTL